MRVAALQLYDILARTIGEVLVVMLFFLFVKTSSVKSMVVFRIGSPYPDMRRQHPNCVPQSPNMIFAMLYSANDTRASASQ